jgi:hypothetical protein
MRRRSSGSVHTPRREEGTIPTADRHIDHALAIDKRWSRIISGAILLAGLLIVAIVLFSGMRDRERTATRVMLGDDSTTVASLLGPPPARCETGTLFHLMNRFPGGTPRVTAEADLVRLRDGTASRWVYPARGDEASCTPRTGATEVGYDAAGEVLWLVPVVGKHPLQYEPNDS